MIFTSSLKKNHEFKRVYNHGRYFADKFFVINVFDNKSACVNRLGISISKRIGNSVQRNRLARLIKENYRLYEKNISRGFDMIFVARVGSCHLDFYQVQKSMLELLSKNKLILI